MELKEYREGLIEDIKLLVASEGISDTEALLEEYKGILIDAEEVDDINLVHFEGIGKKRAKIVIDGYYYDDLDNILTIFICAPINYEELETLTLTDSNKYFNRAVSFIKEAQFIIENAEESSAGYGLAYDIQHGFKNVKKYRIFLLTEMLMSEKIKDIKSGEINNIPLEYSIWDIGRIFSIISSSTGKEDIEIDLLDYSEKGIPCLHANKTDDYDAYLCNIPGMVLARLYNDYGGRLLEGNVRSFLQTKGKVNKGIRVTILNNPSMFFAYNNGIAGTAYGVQTNDDNGQTYITKIKALQIVNGGQTTASLAMALLNDKKDNSEERIKEIFVPMKLSIVSPEKALELIPNISRYANSQNKVSEADLWSNHPFHIRMEDFSRKILAPAVNGKQYGTHWYYERANGQYKQETYKSTAGEKKKFEMLNPSNQLFKKVDLAKYWNIKEMRPDIASAGGQKAFSRFATYVATEWEKDDKVFNKDFFQDMISVAIMFKEADKIVKNLSWYNSYKANIVAYTLSKLFFTVKFKYPDRAIPLHSIWLNQTISDSFKKQIEYTSKEMYDYLIDDSREIENVTEWAKRERCWEGAKKIDIKLYKSFYDELDYLEDVNQKKKDAQKSQKLSNDVNTMIGVVNFGVDNWKELLLWNNSHKVLTPKELDFIKTAIAMEKGKFPTDKQCIKIMEVLEHAREEGFPR